jgi:flagellar assembly protein FliH
LSSTILREAATAQPWRIAPLFAPRLDDTPRETSFREIAPPDPAEILAAARVQAEELLSAARAQSEALLERARDEARQLHEAAYHEGNEEGRAAGREEFVQQSRQAGDLCAGLHAAYERFCLNQAPALAALAADAASTLLGEELSLNPERILSIVRRALDQVTSSSEVTVRLNPEDASLLRGHPALQDPVFSPNVHVMSDETIEPGGCRLESEQGEVDATVGARAELLRECLDDALCGIPA